MAKALNSPSHQEREANLLQVVRIAMLALFVGLLLLLGLSMAHHRFFLGGRVHQNGSIGQ